MKRPAETGRGKDVEEGANEGFLSPPSLERRSSVDLRRFFMGVLVPVLGSAAGFVAGLAALTYVLGLLALWIPISRTYTNGLATAWYATSLIPRTMVAGVGAAKLLAQTTVPFVLATTGIISFIAAFSYAAGRWGYRGMVMVWNVAGVGSLLIMSLVVMRSYLMHENLASLVIAFAALAITWIMARFSTTVARKTGQDVKRYVDMLQGKNWPGKIMWALLCCYIVGFYIFSVVTVLSQPPPLPSVSIAGASNMRGTLLTHTDGFWYVFHRNGKHQQWELIAIPDTEVDTVHVSLKQ